ncbi:LysM peptidoglycan-binding domain-containing protein [Streptomyces sp. A012304]|uniref:LysM peptidoglycan-binding domain-containing protein n=1 Tax=Streptomyces sp. A012304 TaxID=375446 RepID=UPI00222E1BBF|nr:LysM peptidoglycan-binding domain-containing protein [Streptomyces sp. A012304]GKQ33699.1 peptidoglycan-binding protein LysM [Streptomyces sp. A012304]
MLSGNGRHRRPRQAPALLVAAGVTGSAIAIPLLGASGASAADGTVWDKVAECETGGSWSAKEAGGEYGGLALSQEDWEAYGGLDYASRPDLASRNQQIAVAQKLLADQGVGAWGTCGLTSGLSKESGGGTVDTGVPDDSSDSPVSSGLSDLSKGSSGSSNSGGSTGASTDPSAESSTDSSTGDGNSANTPSSSPSSPSASSTPSTPSSTFPSSDADDSAASNPSDGSGSSGSREAEGSPAATPGADDSDKSGQSAGSWSLVDTGSLDTDSLGSGRHRGASAEEGTDGASAASTGRHAANTLGGTAGAYTVRSGDSLVSIADSLDLDGGWRALYAENRDLIGADPSAIVPGQTLDTGIE